MFVWSSPVMAPLVWGDVAAPWLTSVHVPPASEGGFEPGDLDPIEEHPEATSLRIVGLDQHSFELLIDRFGDRFTGLGIWGSPRIEDLSPLEAMPQLTHLAIGWNQRATRLWDLDATPSLAGLHLSDFKRLHSLEELRSAGALEQLEVADGPGRKGMSIESLEPLAGLTQLRDLCVVVRRVDDGRVQPLAALQRLERLHFPINLWTTEQCAWLRAHLPPHCDGRVLQATERWEHRIGAPMIRIVGKRKPLLDPEDDIDRIQHYVERWDELVARFSADPKLDP